MRGIALSLVVCLGLAACGGDDVNTNVVNRTTTHAAEAVDLQRALAAGLITKAEYNDQLTKLGLDQ